MKLSDSVVAWIGSDKLNHFGLAATFMGCWLLLMSGLIGWWSLLMLLPLTILLVLKEYKWDTEPDTADLISGVVGEMLPTVCWLISLFFH